MKTVTELFRRALSKRAERSYPNFYVAVDLHGTVFVPDRLTKFLWNDGGEKPSEMAFSKILKEKVYPNAIECLKILCASNWFSKIGCKLIVWTSGKGEDLEDSLKYLKDSGVVFSYVNENPDFMGNSYADFSKKFCFDVLLDDKAGFDPETDWTDLLKFLRGIAYETIAEEEEVPNEQHC